MQYNKIISPVNFVVSNQDVDQEADQIHTAMQFAVVTNPEIFARHSRVLESLEVYLRRMISHCALEIAIPTSSAPGVATPQAIKRLLTPSLKGRICFVDRRGTIWDALASYFEPIATEFVKGQELADKQLYLSYLAWQFYLLILAAKENAEAIVSPSRASDMIEKLNKNVELSRESRARLAVMAGLFSSFSQPIDSPSLRFSPACSAKTILERVSEILEDAYLLEASNLRRSLAISRNRAYIQRKLRRLLEFIRQHSPWAKGIVDIGTQTLLAAPALSGPANMALEIIAQFGAAHSHPVLVSEDIYFDEYLDLWTEALFTSHRCITGGWISYARVCVPDWKNAIILPPDQGESNGSMNSDQKGALL